MGRWCVVPDCKAINHWRKPRKHSVFRVPKDTERLKQWEEAIPGNLKLKEAHVLCERHFAKDVILREWIHRNSSGEIIARVPYKHPRLSDVAVPTIFGTDVPPDKDIDDKNTNDVDDSVESADAPHEMEYIDCSKPDDSEDPTEYEFVATFKDDDSTFANGSNLIDDESVAKDSAIEYVSDSVLPITKDVQLNSSTEVLEVESATSTVMNTKRTARHRKSNSTTDSTKHPFAVFSTVSIEKHSDFAGPITANNDSPTPQSPEADYATNLRKKTYAVVSTVANNQMQQSQEQRSTTKRSYSFVDSDSDPTTPIRSGTLGLFTAQQRKNSTNSRVDQTTNACTLTADELACTIPPSWGVADLPRETGQLLVFSYTVTKFEHGIYFPITQRCVTLDAEKNIEYFVYGRRVSPDETILDRNLDSTESVSNILLMFQWMSICNGLGNVASEFIPAEGAYLDYVQLWRDNDCALLSSRKRCDYCAQLRRRVLMETARVNGRASRRRCRKFMSPMEIQQLNEIRRINRLQRRKARRIELRKQKMLESIDAGIDDATLKTEIDADTLKTETDADTLKTEIDADTLKTDIDGETFDDRCYESNELTLSMDDHCYESNELALSMDERCSESNEMVALSIDDHCYESHEMALSIDENEERSD